MAYPVEFSADYGTGERSRWLAVLGIILWKGILLVPHAFILIFVYLAALFMGWVGYFIVLFTGKRLPDGIHNLLANTIGWALRLQSWSFSLTDAYPPFEFDPVSYEVEFAVTDDSPDRNRWLALTGVLGLKFALALPHLIVVWVLSIGLAIGGWIGYWIIAFTGQANQGIHEYIEGVLRWTGRVSSWIAGLTDEYPPFSLDVQG
ncbi:MAG: DUF4389 domain-containing protein [Acidimicrobiia bacterium]